MANNFQRRYLHLYYLDQLTCSSGDGALIDGQMWPRSGLKKSTGTQEHSFRLCSSHWQHRNRHLSHTLSQLRLSFPSPIPLLLSAPLPKNIPHPASSYPSPPSSFPITHYPLYHLDLWARFLMLTGPHRTVEVEARASFSTSSLLHYSDYHKKSYITLAPHGIRFSTETTSSSVSSPLSPAIKSSTPPLAVCHVYSRHQWTCKGYSHELSG